MMNKPLTTSRKKMKSMKLGIMGGLGPLASAYFYEQITEMTRVRGDQDHLEIFLHSFPQIPDRTDFILDHTKPNPLPYMGKSAQTLETLGVDVIAIPCITAHYFHDDLQSYTNVPIIHLIKEVADYLKRNDYECVGLLATDGTVQSRIFQDELENHGIKVVVPNEARQKDVMHVIYEDVKKGKRVNRTAFERASGYLSDHGAEIIILGCTELSIVRRELKLDDHYLDAMQLLAAKAIISCHKPIKENYKYLVY